MITINKIHPSGALECSAMVTDIMTRESFLKRQVYYGYNKAEARKAFVMLMIEEHLIEMLDY